MRLINTHTGRLELFTTSPLPDYAILSHVWAKNQGEVPEQTFGSVNAIQTRFPTSGSILGFLSQKVQRACKVADEAGYNYIWIDTCCIDKSSSSELSEAINSMYAWYLSAKMCFAYLADVHGDDNSIIAKFRSSDWFKRVWTLQELIAPPTVVFLSRSWNSIGSKASLAQTIHEVTNINVEVLQRSMPLSDVSVARRMSWAAKRRASKIEDVAYSLLGIFGVSLTLNYGEGRHAFARLQEAIMLRIPDQTLFAWGPPPTSSLPDDSSSHISRTPSGTPESCLLAKLPKDFENWSNVQTISPGTLEKQLNVKIPNPELTVTAYGVRASMPVVKHSGGVQLAILALTNATQDIISLVLRTPQKSRGGKDVAVGFVPHTAQQEPVALVQNSVQLTTRLVKLTPEFLKQHRPKVQDVYIRYDVAARLPPLDDGASPLSSTMRDPHSDMPQDVFFSDSSIALAPYFRCPTSQIWGLTPWEVVGWRAPRASFHPLVGSGVPTAQALTVVPMCVPVEISNPQQENITHSAPSQSPLPPFRTEHVLSALPNPTPAAPGASQLPLTHSSPPLGQSTSLNGHANTVNRHTALVAEPTTSANEQTPVDPPHNQASRLGLRWWKPRGLGDVPRKLVNGMGCAVGKIRPSSSHEFAHSAAGGGGQRRNEGLGEGQG